MVNATATVSDETDSSFEAMPNVTRKWELFPGNNKFCCDGRIMTAPNTGVFYLTTTLIVGTSILFFTFDCPFLAARITPAIPIVGGLMFIFVISTFLRTSFSDPGVIPRATPDEAAYIEKQLVPNNANSPTYRPPPRTKEIQVRGHLVKLKYCSTCKIFRPPRASHCSLCDNCVERFDHHCPWVGNCVGKRNYRHFYMFIVSLSFLCVFIFACAVTHLILLTREDKQFIDAVKDSPASVISGLICFLSVWTILGLSGFHTYLTASNQTTNEDIKGVFTRRRGTDGFNPYSESNICSNCLFVLCAPVTPSLIDRRGIVTPEYAAEREAEKLREQEMAAANNKTYGSNGVPVPQEAQSQTPYPQQGINQQERPPMMDQAKYPHFQMSHQQLVQQQQQQQQQHLQQLQQSQMQQERVQPPNNVNNVPTPGSGKSLVVRPSPAHPTSNGSYLESDGAGNHPYGHVVGHVLSHVVGPYNYASLPSRRHHYRGATDYRIRQFSPYRDTVAVQNCWDDVYLSRMSGGEGFTCTVDVASTSMGGGSVGFHRNYAVGPRTGMGCSVIGTASGFVVPVYGQPVNHVPHGYGQPAGSAGSAGGLMGFEEVFQQCAPYSETYVNFGRTGKSGLQMAYKVTSASNSDDDCGLSEH